MPLSSQGQWSPAAANPLSDPNLLAGMFMAYAMQLQQQNPQVVESTGAHVVLDNVTFHPPGAEQPLLQGVSLSLAANKLGLIIGRSGSGKTTLLQVLAGLSEQNSGDVYISRGLITPQSPLTSKGEQAGSMAGAGPSENGPQPCEVEDRMKQVGLVFQFPERHFLGEDVLEELVFTWPRKQGLEYMAEQNRLSMRLQQVVQAVGLTNIPFNIPPTALSGGQQRRLALATQLLRQPSLILLDEPLAGLDWRSRAEVVQLIAQLKEQCTLLVVSHDLKEISHLVDCAWRMKLGGTLEEVPWPPENIEEYNS